MISTLKPHPDQEVLLRWLDDDLSIEERQEVNDHLGRCSPCQRDLEEVREALGGYQQFHRAVLSTAYPPPPKPWDRLDLLVARIPERTRSPRRWLAVAAAIAAVFLAARLFERTPAVKAAELLRKAASAEKAAPPPVRAIRIKSRKYKWDRPSRLLKGSDGTSADAAGIRKLLDSAGYTWDDPLSAEAFLRWHDSLALKQDRVESLAQALVIHTAAASNLITEASLTLRSDLRPIMCTLRFGDMDTVEMTEVQDAEPPGPATAPAGAVPASPTPGPTADPVRLAGPGDELRVIAALHRIGADLGEPVDVRREGESVVVNVAGLDASRQGDVKSALAGLPAVRLQFSEPEPHENRNAARRPEPQLDTANPLLSELQAASADRVTAADLADQLTNHTEKMIERVYALRALARRFSADETALLRTAEVAMLNRIVNDHAAVAATSAAAIETLLQPVLPRLSRSPAAIERSWQDVAQGLRDDARDLDEALNPPGASGARGNQTVQAAQALAGIQQRLNRLRTLTQP